MKFDQIQAAPSFSYYLWLTIFSLIGFMMSSAFFGMVGRIGFEYFMIGWEWMGLFVR